METASPNRWMGLSTDTKPSSPAGAGHRFIETDTGKTWLWTGTAWTENLELKYAMNNSTLAKAP